MITFFIADHHFGHNNIIDYEKRPFESKEEMETSMIKAWNDVVSNQDMVYILGDFSFGGYDIWSRILKQLNGKIKFVKGNHDKKKVINRLLREGLIEEFHEVGTAIKVDNTTFNLTHYPLMIGERPLQFNVSGHIHGQPSAHINQFNVGVDSSFSKEYRAPRNLPFGTPIPLDYLLSKAGEVTEIIAGKYGEN